MNSYHILILTFSFLISVGYLNFCTSNNDLEGEAAPRIWPNISGNSSFLQFPGLTGSGGLDISFYDILWATVNTTRRLPWTAIRKSNFTILQIAIMGAVGAIATGAASLIAEAGHYKYRDKHHHHHHGHFKRRKDPYNNDDHEIPLQLLHSPEYRSPDDDSSPPQLSKYHYNFKPTKYAKDKPLYISKSPQRFQIPLKYPKRSLSAAKYSQIQNLNGQGNTMVKKQKPRKIGRKSIRKN